MKLGEKIELLEEIMDLDEGIINEETVLKDLEEWDSLSKLGLMAEVKRLMNKKLSVEEISKFTTIGDIIAYLQ